MDSQDTTTTQETVNTQDGSSVLLNLEELIKSHLSSIDRLEKELKKYSGMLDDIFANDPTYKKHSEDAKEAARIKSATKQQILKQPSVAELAQKVKTMKDELKDLKGALSDYLQEYQRMSGANEIEGYDGEVHQIVYVAKLVRKPFLAHKGE